MEVGEWVQLISVLVATFAALASWMAVRITAKQFKLNEEQKRLQIKPLFRIETIHRTHDGFFLEINSLGYPFFQIKDVKFTSEGINIKKQFNGEVGSNRQNVRDSLIINAEVTPGVSTDGEFIITVLDVGNKEYLQKSPIFRIENGNIKNGIEIHKQFFSDV